MAWKLGRALICGVLLLGGADRASADPIIAPVGATIQVGGLGSGSIGHTFNRLGLTVLDPLTLEYVPVTYTTGVTDFDAFLAGNPLHTSTFAGFEWFSTLGQTTAQVTYDLGAVFSVGKLALWNEESSGVGFLSLSYSLSEEGDFVAVALAQNLEAFDNPAKNLETGRELNPTPDYRANVFPFETINARYIRFNMTGCGDLGQNNDYVACAIGEVAFSGVAVPEPVPEPGTMLLLGSGLAAFAARRRRQRS